MDVNGYLDKLMDEPTNKMPEPTKTNEAAKPGSQLIMAENYVEPVNNDDSVAVMLPATAIR
jgi:hypothetical protein